VTLGNIIRRLTGLCRPLSRFGWQCHREKQSTMPSWCGSCPSVCQFNRIKLGLSRHLFRGA